MPRVVLAPAIARWLNAEPASSGTRQFAIAGQTVRIVLDNLFELHPNLRSYLLDEHGELRHHVVAFLNGEAVRDKKNLADPVSESDELFLFQALSGG